MKQSIYFSHDANASSDTKILKVRMKYGREGVGIFWYIVENLMLSNTHHIQKSDIESLSYQANIEEEKFLELIYFYEKVGLLKYDDGGYFSERMMKNIENIEILKQKKSEAGRLGNEKRRGNRQSIAEQSHSDSNAITEQSQNIANKIKENEIKGNEMKENENKEKEMKENNPLSTEREEREESKDKKGVKVFQKPTIEMIAEYVKEKGYTFSPEAFRNFYQSKGRMVGKNKMKDRHSACGTRGAKRKDEEKEKVKADQERQQQSKGTILTSEEEQKLIEIEKDMIKKGIPTNKLRENPKNFLLHYYN